MLTRRIVPMAAALLAALSFTATVRADETADAKKAITAAYAKIDAAAAKKDAKNLFASFTTDYAQTSSKGQKMTLAQVKGQVPQMFAMAQSIKSKTTLLKFALKGKEAVASIHSQMEISMMDPQTNKVAKMAMDAASDDTWVKTPKGWMIKRSKGTKEKMTVDGKAVPQ